jgi:hypothetical protein
MTKTSKYLVLMAAIALCVPTVNAQTGNLVGVTIDGVPGNTLCVATSHTSGPIEFYFDCSGLPSGAIAVITNPQGATYTSNLSTNSFTPAYAGTYIVGHPTLDPDLVSGTYDISITANGNTNTISEDINIGDGLADNVSLDGYSQDCDGGILLNISPFMGYTLPFIVNWNSASSGSSISNSNPYKAFTALNGYVVQDVGGCGTVFPVNITPSGVPIAPTLNIPANNAVTVGTQVQPINGCIYAPDQLQRKFGNQWFNVVNTNVAGQYRMKRTNQIGVSSYKTFMVIKNRPHCGWKTAGSYDAIQNPPNCTYTLYDMSGRLVTKVNESGYNTMLRNAKPDAYSLVVCDENKNVIYTKKIVLPK